MNTKIQDRISALSAVFLADDRVYDAEELRAQAQALTDPKTGKLFPEAAEWFAKAQRDPSTPFKDPIARDVAGNIAMQLGGVESSSLAAVRPVRELPEGTEVHPMIVLGGGPAGWSAALYAARANRSPLVITGDQQGGQIIVSNEVENYPGFPDGITGAELAGNMQAQAEKFGAKVESDYITEVDFSQRPFKLVGEKTYYADSVVLATGAKARKLGVPGEEELTGRGVSFCATCDGFFFRGQDVVVVGGGDSALEEALFLTKFANKVTIVHRRDELRGSAILQERVAENEKIQVLFDTEVKRIAGEENVTGVQLENNKTGEKTELAAGGVFVAVGHVPNNWLYEGQLEMDSRGMVVVDDEGRTSISGVWAAGESADAKNKQVITSAGMGVEAALSAERWLSDRERTLKPKKTRSLL